MQRELENLLNAINFDKSLYHLFDNARVKSASKSDVLEGYKVDIELTDYIDPRIFDLVISKSLEGNTKFDIYFSCANEPTITLIQEYYKYYLQKLYKEGLLLDNLLSLPVELSDKNILITCKVATISDTLLSFKDALIKGFNKAGIFNNIKVICLADSNETIEQVIKEEQKIIPTVNKNVSAKEEDFKSQKNDEFYKGYKKATISEISDDDAKIEFEGKIFDVVVKETRKGTKIYSIYVTDYKKSLMIKATESKFLSSELLDSLSKGKWISVRGGMEKDNYYNDYYVRPHNIIVLDKNDERFDDASNKRVELHCHTKMSTMDGVATAEDYIKQAVKWGHKAIAFTDHGSVQCYPEAQDAAKGKDIKLIYGMEGYIVNNKRIPAYNSSHVDLRKATYISFDLETTGLSNRYDKIIECGFVRVENGQIVDTFQCFVNPLTKLDPAVSELTNITDDMLIGAETIDQVMPKLKAFMGDDILVAHNASFDIGFLNAALKELGQDELSNPVIDTLDLAHIMYPNLKRFNLGSLCKHFGVDYDEDEAHRADYDATVLADCLVRIVSELENQNIFYHDELNDLSKEDAYLTERPYHMNFLVKNDIGLKNLYKLVSLSHTEYITYLPLIPREKIEEYREGLLIGSSCFNGEVFDIAQTKSYEELKKAMQYYDYIEIQPLDNYMWLVQTRRILSKERLISILQDIVKCALELNKTVVATGDCHYINPEDKIFRDVYIGAQGVGGKFHPLHDKKCNESPIQHFRTTNEMIEGISYVNDIELQRKFVIDNSNYIASLIDNVYPVKDKLFTPHLHGIDADQEIRDLCNKRAHELYGAELPKLIEDRMNLELNNIISNGYGVIYYLAYRLVKKSNQDGYLVGSRGSVGSSFVASLCGITEVNPLPPHYLCPSCHHVEFIEDGSVRSGFDLDNKVCPKCGEMMNGNGQNIPFETFLGLEGDKVPDIDLNFSRDYQATAHDYTKVLCGEKNVFRAGTISTVAEKTAFGYARGYFENRNITDFREADLRRLAVGCADVKRTTGQHPAGIVVVPEDMDVYDFTPIQYPADDVNSAWKTTHFNFKSIHDEILKLDILGHLDPMAVKMLKDLTGIEPESIPMNDPEVLKLFTGLESLHVEDYEVLNSIGTSGVPEFGTGFVKGVVDAAKPSKFSDLVQISGLTHGTDVWEGNASSLIANGTCKLNDVIGCRDDIMTDLIRYGLNKKDSFDIMEFVRKGKASKDPVKWSKYAGLMKEHNVPEWYIDSCFKIKYMFPKAHAVAYVVMALRVAWFKVHYPLEYYAAFFSVRCEKYELETMIKGHGELLSRVQELRNRIKQEGNSLSNTVTDLYDTLELCLEMTARGYKFENISLEKSDAVNFVVDKEHNSLIPPFIVIDGLGEAVAKTIIEQRKVKPFISKEDLMNRTSINKTQVDTLDKLGVLKGLNDQNQLSFDF